MHFCPSLGYDVERCRDVGTLGDVYERGRERERERELVREKEEKGGKKLRMMYLEERKMSK